MQANNTLPPFGLSIHCVVPNPSPTSDPSLIFTPFDPEDTRCNHWLPLVERIRGNTPKIEHHKDYDPKLDIRWIHLLLIDPVHLSQPYLLDALPNAPFRKTVQPSERFKGQCEGRFNPIISISHEDFSEVFAHYGTSTNTLPDTHWQHLNPDPRIKFLDSGIWHRYVPEMPSEGTFSEVFVETLSEIKSYWDLGLYYTVPAVSGLDLQLRMLSHSYIGPFGEGGHAAVVTPFKFHSERYFKRRLKDESDFFLRLWGDQSLVEALCWRCLAIDDNADEILSTVDNERYQSRVSVKKSLLLRRPIDQLYEEAFKRRLQLTAKNENNNGRKTSKGLQKQFEIISPQSKKGIVNQCLNLLRKRSFDILFLDYLLGEQIDNANREYGHAFLLALIQKRNDTQIRRDFMGRHWIFPISSFPFALSDKLIQLGIGHSQPIWHLSTGGDPVSSPYLYAYYLLRFMKERVREYFLYPNALGRLLDAAPEFENDAKGSLWAQALSNALLVHKNQIQVMKNALEDNDDSQFLGSMSRFKMLDHIEVLTGDMRSIVTELANPKIQLSYAEVGELINKVKNKAKEMQEYDYDKVINKFLNKAIGLTTDQGLKEAEKAIQKAVKRGETTLVLDNLRLTKIPPIIAKLKNVRILSLVNNRLEDLYCFQHLKGLEYIEKIHLDGNPILLQQLYSDGIIECGFTSLYKNEVLKLLDHLKNNEKN